MIELLKIMVMLVDAFMNINLHFLIELFEFLLDFYMLKYDVREWEKNERKTGKLSRKLESSLSSSNHLSPIQNSHIRIQFSVR